MSAITTIFGIQLKARSDDEIREWEWRNDVLPMLERAKVEPRYRNEISDWPEPKQERVFDLVTSLCKGTGAIVALVGPRGTGKTTLATQCIVRNARQGVMGYYRKCVDVIARYKPLYADFGSTDTDALMSARNSFCRFPLVVIDELHECDEQRLKARVLPDVLDRRYAAKVDTILISNQTPEEFQQTTSDSVLSRLTEHGAIIPCEWASFRVRRNRQ